MEDRLTKLKKYNFWDRNLPDLGYLRKSYTDDILSYSNNRLIKVIVGQRRAGKSYILRQIANELISKGVNPINIFYFNQEFIDFDFVSHYSDLEDLVRLYKQKYKPEGKTYLLIDEIQNIEEWERFVNSYSQDFTAQYELFITGSNSKMLSGELATLLSGRYVSFEVFPFGFLEYSAVTNQDPSKESYIKYMGSGGLPELFKLPNEQTRRNYTASVMDTVLLRDIIQHFTVGDPKLLEVVFVYLINNASNLVSINNIANFMKSSGRKTTYDTVANYIGYIEDAYLIHKAERYDIKGKDIISGTSKYYSNDLAYKNYLYSGFGYGIGYKLENLVYLELKRAGFQVYVGVVRNKEVDFVAKKADAILYVQCAYLLLDEQTVKREYASLEAIKDNYPKIVVSLDDVQLSQNQGIRHIQAWRLYEFLSSGWV